MTKTEILILLARVLGVIVGAIANMLLVLAIYALGTLMDANNTQSMLVGCVFAYPLAKIANKYAKLGFMKLFKV